MSSITDRSTARERSPVPRNRPGGLVIPNTSTSISPSASPDLSATPVNNHRSISNPNQRPPQLTLATTHLDTPTSDNHAHAAFYSARSATSPSPGSTLGLGINAGSIKEGTYTRHESSWTPPQAKSAIVQGSNSWGASGGARPLSAGPDGQGAMSLLARAGRKLSGGLPLWTVEDESESSTVSASPSISNGMEGGWRTKEKEKARGGNDKSFGGGVESWIKGVNMGNGKVARFLRRFSRLFGRVRLRSVIISIVALLLWIFLHARKSSLSMK